MAYGNSKWCDAYWATDGDGNKVVAEGVQQLAWDLTRHNKIDVRLFYAFREAYGEKDSGVDAANA